MRPPAWFDRLDRRVATFMADHGLLVLRVALGIVFLWFGALKFFPGLSPAQDLAARTIDVLSLGLVPPSVSLPVLAAWEVAIGVGLLIGRWMRLVLLLLFAQMLGTVTPLVLFPAETWTVVPIAPTLEGQYIIKNVVLVAAAIVLGATVRGGELTAEPVVATASSRDGAVPPSGPPPPAGAVPPSGGPPPPAGAVPPSGPIVDGTSGPRPSSDG